MLEAAHQRRPRAWTSSSAMWRPTAGPRPRPARRSGGRPAGARSSTAARRSTELDLDAVLARAPAAGPGRRAGPHQRAGLAASQALPGRGGAPGRRHRRLHHAQRPAPGEPNDVVAQITGVRVRETVPDRCSTRPTRSSWSTCRRTSCCERLREGKVYVPEQAARAIEQFLPRGQPDRPARAGPAARRRAGRRPDAAYMQHARIPGPWPAGERLLVCVSPSPLSERLVRAAKRAGRRAAGAEWFAAVRRDARTPPIPRQRERAVRATCALAEDLGAESRRCPATSVAETVVDYARKHNVTKIVAGKPLRPRWRELLAARSSTSSSERAATSTSTSSAARPAGAAAERPQLPNRRPAVAGLPVQRCRWWCVATLSAALWRTGSATNLVMLYLAAVVLSPPSTWAADRRPGGAPGVLAFDFFFVPPSPDLRGRRHPVPAHLRRPVRGRAGDQLPGGRVREQARGGSAPRAQTSGSTTSAATWPAQPTRGRSLTRSSTTSSRCSAAGGGPARRRATGSSRRPPAPIAASTKTSWPWRTWAFEHGAARRARHRHAAGAACTYLPLRTARG